MEELKIIQHNVLKWTKSRGNELSNIYGHFNPDIILINSTGKIDNNKIKIHQYNVYHRNISNEDNAGIALAIKSTISHKIMDSYNDDVMGVEIETNRGKIIIATSYIPPRYEGFNLQSLLSIARKPVPVYIYADLNARHTNLGHSSCNDRGRLLVNLIRRDILTNIGPDFKTFISDRGTGTPDIVLGNRHSNLNITLTQGPITTSDHIPIYSKLATKPIVIKGRKLLQIKKQTGFNLKQS